MYNKYNNENRQRKSSENEKSFRNNNKSDGYKPYSKNRSENDKPFRGSNRDDDNRKSDGYKPYKKNYSNNDRPYRGNNNDDNGKSGSYRPYSRNHSDNDKPFRGKGRSLDSRRSENSQSRFADNVRKYDDNKFNKFSENKFIKKDRFTDKRFADKPFKNTDDYDEDNDIENNSATDEPKNDYIIGRNPVIEALKAEKPIDTIFVNSEAGGSINHIIAMAKEQNIVVKEVSEAKLTGMTNGASHQGIIAVGAYAEYVSVEDILKIAENKGEEPFIIICDEIEDPHNLGALIRTAEAAGAHGLIIPKRRSATVNFIVNKTSAGAASWLPVARVANLCNAIDILKKNGVWIYGTDAQGEDYTKANLTGSIGLVVGSEGFGMGRLVKEKCDFLMKLPMMGKITSLNASVAGGIFMYEILRQKLNAKK